jgi:RimJ/RimL family protein N-acetyltransferase
MSGLNTIRVHCTLSSTGSSEVSTMMDAAKYSAVEQLGHGRRIEIRALKPDDEADLLAAVDRASVQSLYRRFFAMKREFSEKEIAYFVNVDFLNHVALVAVAEEGGQAMIVGGGRYVVVRKGSAELAFAVIDEYQGKGIGAALMRHLIMIARNAGLKQLVAEVLPDNTPMLNVFKKCGLSIKTARETDVVHVVLQLG